ncbi:MAG: restriction endonuclease subunit S [Candidatus Lindowbacteria bacterium]|nr:restriction endonuclease subunit S [Candidatus Lindowbacteria bacterium]
MSDRYLLNCSLTRLSNITTKIGSGATPHGGKESYKASGITLIRSLNVYDFAFSEEGLAFIDEDQAAELSNVEVQLNDILLNITGASVARCCIVPNKVLPARVNQHVAIIRTNLTLADPHFLLYSINSPKYKHHLLTLAQGGATREALTKDTIGNFEIHFPPLATQRKIASILSAYDDLIENNMRRIKILEEMAQLIYREWFVKFRFPGHKKIKMADSPMGKIPEGWEVKKSSEVLWINPREGIARGKEKPYVAMDGLSADSMMVTPKEMRASNGGSKFRNGDTLFARITPCLENGKTGFVQFLPPENEVGIGSTEFIVLRSKTLCPEYVYLLARLEDFRGNAVKSMTGASGRQRVQVECFEKYLVAQPDKQTLGMFSTFVKPTFKEAFVLHQKNENLRRTRDLLLPKLISGELHLSELDISNGDQIG